MGLFLRLTLVLCLYAAAENVLARICNSTGNGNWNHAATWDCGSVPQGGDTIIVQAGHTVSVTQNHVYNGTPLHIMIYGVWYFSGGGSKITLPCGSFVEIMVGGMLVPNSNSGGHSETVRICNVTYWYFDEGPQAGYQIWPPITLPIELISFSGTALTNSVLLQWATASERNSDHFELYISEDGFSRELLRTISAQGNSTATVHYSYLDEPRSPGLWYYSLVEVDMDGTRSDQGTIAVMVSQRNKGITCMPNPVDEGHLLISFKEELTDAVVSIVALDSRSVHDPYRIWEDGRMLALDVAILQPGFYMALVSSGDQHVETCSFVIK